MIRAGLLIMMLTQGPTGHVVEVTISCADDGKLRYIKTGGSLLETPGGRVDDSAIHRLLPDRTARIVLTNSIETPYRCVGQLIYELQRMRYLHIGFISEPPPPEE